MVTHNFTVDGTGTPTYTNTSGAVTATYYNGDTWADENGVLAEIDNTGTDDTVNVVIADGVWTATNIFYIGLFAAQDDGEVEIFNIELPYGWTSVEQDGGSAGFEPGGGEESFYFYHATRCTRITLS